MFYFVPAWYDQNRKWFRHTPYWFRVSQQMTFDDTVNQIKMFQGAQEDTGLLMLNYNPQLRYYLHKQDLLGTVYWSFFDDIQNVNQHETNPLTVKDLNWPDDIEVVFSPFAQLIRQNGQTLAHVHFAENGNLLSIDYHEAGRLDRIYYFDDRGFLSSVCFYDEKEQPLFHEYLNPKGVWQVREDLRHGKEKIMVNPQADSHFQQSVYGSWEELMVERLQFFEVKYCHTKDCFVIASHPQHNQLLSQIFPNYQRVFSFFGNRYNPALDETFGELVEQASLLITDKKSTEKALRHQLTVQGLPMKQILLISPFDTRLRLGHSQHEKQLIIYFLIDQLEEGVFDSTLPVLLQEMETNPLIHLEIVSYDLSRNMQELATKIDRLIFQQYQTDLFFEQVPDVGENQIDEAEEVENQRIRCQVLTNETQIIKQLDKARLVMDFSPIPDLYTQIASISAGVPQVNLYPTEYVEHQKNGWLLDKPEDVSHPIHFYFDGLANWNQALVYAVEKMSDYTSGRLLARWKEVLTHD